MYDAWLATGTARPPRPLHRGPGGGRAERCWPCTPPSPRRCRLPNEALDAGLRRGGLPVVGQDAVVRVGDARDHVARHRAQVRDPARTIWTSPAAWRRRLPEGLGADLADRRHLERRAARVDIV